MATTNENMNTEKKLTLEDFVPQIPETVIDDEIINDLLSHKDKKRNNQIEVDKKENKEIEQIQSKDKQIEKENQANKDSQTNKEDKVEDDEFEEVILESKPVKEIISETNITPNEAIETIQNVLDDIDNVENEKDIRSIKKIVKELIDEGLIREYEGDKKIEDYTIKEIRQLLKDNINAIKEEAFETAINNFVETLPESLQLAIKFAVEAEDDTNLPEILRMIADIHEGKSILDRLNDEGVIALVLRNRGMDEDEIQIAIESYKKKGILEQKAQQLKEEAKQILDNNFTKVEQDILDRKEKIRKGYEEFTKKIGEYINQLDYNINKKELLEYILKPDVQSPISGKQTTKLYADLEKYQFIEQRPDLIFEVAWLLKDPEGYKKWIQEKVKANVIADEIKPKLKKATDKIAKSQPDVGILGKDTEIQISNIKRENRKKFNWDIFEE